MLQNDVPQQPSPLPMTPTPPLSFTTWLSNTVEQFIRKKHSWCIKYTNKYLKIVAAAVLYNVEPYLNQLKYKISESTY